MQSHGASPFLLEHCYRWCHAAPAASSEPVEIPASDTDSIRTQQKLGQNIVAAFDASVEKNRVGAHPWAVFAYLESFTSPDPFKPIGIHHPALLMQQRRDPAIAIAATLLGQPDDHSCQWLFVG